jgi:alpha-beta hydrolase superfamily lysophospholipase
MPERVTFQTEDGVTIVGHFYAGPAGGPAALLLHMMPATKESWAGLADKLVAAGFSVLAIDERGHGESITGPGGKRLDYILFSEREQQAKRLDVEAAADWLMRRSNTGRSRLVVCGASIGANLAIAYAAEHPETPAAVALSPGLDYRGVTTLDKVRKMRPEQGLFLAASEEDERSFVCDRKLAEAKPDAVVKEYRGAGHGTAMFDPQLELMDEIVAWLAGRASR